MKKLSFMDTGFLLSESRETPMHVGGVSLYTVPEGADAKDFLHSLADNLRNVTEFMPPSATALKRDAWESRALPTGSPTPPWISTTISATRHCPSRAATGSCSPWYRACTPPCWIATGLCGRCT